MEKRKWLSLLLAVTMLFTSIPVGMFAEGEDPVVEETATVEEVTIEEPAPAPEVKEEPAPAPAPEKKEEPAPAPEKKEEPAPVVEEKEEPAPVVEEKEEPAPVVEEKDEPAPVVEEKEEPAPVVEEKEEPAPSEGGESVPAEGTEPAAEPIVTEEGEPEGDAVPEETGTEPAEDVTPVVEPEPVPEVEEVEEETEAFKAGLAYLSSGEVFEDKQLQKAYGTVNSKAVVYATDRITGEGELSGSDVIRISANIEGQEKTLYVKNGRLTYLSADETAAYNDEKHEEGIACRGTKLDPVSFTPAEKPETETEPTEEPVPTEPTGEEPTEEPVPTEPTGEEPTETPVTTDPTGEEPTETPVTTEPTGEEPTETPVTTEPTGEEPTEEPVPTEPTVEEPTEEPVPTEPTVEEPTEEPVPTEPTVEEPTEEPVPTEPTVDAIAVEIVIDAVEDTNEDENTPVEEDVPFDITALLNRASVDETNNEGNDEVQTNTDELEESDSEEEELDQTNNTIISVQPQNVTINAIGDLVTFTVVATGARSYRWYRSNDEGETWVPTTLPGYDTDTLSFVSTEARIATPYRCRVISEDGVEYYTDAVTAVVAPPAFVITEQPQNVTIAEMGETVTFTVVATGVRSYRWFRSNDEGVTWVPTTLPGYNTDTLSFASTEARIATPYRCVLTDLDGVEHYTDAVTAVVAPPAFVITEQPQNVTIAEMGETVTFTVVATGVRSYRWFRSNDEGATWVPTTLPGYNTDTLSFASTEARIATPYRCVLTDLDGVEHYTDAVTAVVAPPAFVITEQPQNVTIAEMGETVTFTVVATGVRSYRWFRSNDEGATWVPTTLPGYNTDTLSFASTEARIATPYRCVLTDLDGVEHYTDAVTAVVAPPAFVITEQPQNVTIAEMGETVTFTVVATGVRSYRWFRSNDEGATWVPTTLPGYNTDTLSFASTEARIATPYRCVLTDLDGVEHYTDAVTAVLIPPSIVITEQPHNVTIAAIGDTVTFKVVATGVSSYRWFRSNDEGATWVPTTMAGYDTDTLSFVSTEARIATPYRCRLTDADGVEYFTNAVTAVVAPPSLVITEQPQNVTIAAIGDTVTFTVAATGARSYRWFRSNDGGATWVPTTMAGYDTDTLSFVSTEARIATPYRCRLTDADGVEYFTNAVTAVVAPPALEILEQPQNVTIAAIGDTVTFTVVATGARSYRWFRSNDEGATWVPTTMAGYDTDTLSFVSTEARIATPYRCRLIDADGVEHFTNAVTAVVAPPALEILEQPQDVTIAAIGDTVTFTVVATGARSYRWFRSNDEGATWVPTTMAGYDTDTLSFVSTEARIATPYRCRLIDADGVEHFTNAVTAVVAPPALEILEQPQNVTIAAIGDTVTFTVVATGVSSYRWFRSNDEGATWVPTTMAGYDTDTLSFVSTEARIATPYRCRLLDANGVEYFTDPVSASLVTTFTVDQVTYERLDDETLRIVSYDGNSATVTIPETVEGKTVTIVGEGAFENNQTLVCIDLPDTILVIERRAFAGCSSLSEMR